MLKRVAESRRLCQTPTFTDGTGGLVIEVFNDSDTVGADDVLLHSCLSLRLMYWC